MLSRQLYPKYLYDLIRIGSRNDGGYLVEYSSIEKSDFLISLGISVDWKFEKCCHKKYGMDFLGVDDQISIEFVSRYFWKNLYQLFVPRKVVQFLDFTRDALYYFKNRHRFRKGFISEKKGYDYVALSTLIEGVDPEKRLFLKIDIEGSEYGILDTISKYQSRVEGLVMEFHDCPSHMNDILNFIDKLGLELVHIHPNNHASVQNCIPLVLEISFARNPKALKASVPELPHSLDRPCNAHKKDIMLNFKS